MATSDRATVALRPMTDLEFPAWREIAIEHHAGQVSRATGKNVEAAITESRELLAKVLPAGLATSKMYFFVVTDETGHEVGWLWLGASPQDPTAGFVFDVIIGASVRGRGYGRAAMRAAEDFFLNQGMARIGLDVAAGNDTARRLYDSMGYLPIMTSMSKPLRPT